MFEVQVWIDLREGGFVIWGPFEKRERAEDLVIALAANPNVIKAQVIEVQE